MNWYITKFAGSKEEYLQSLNIPQNIIQYILSIADPQSQQHLINVVRQNPQITMEELNKMIQGIQQPRPVTNPYIPFLKTLLRSKIRHNWISQRKKQEFERWLGEQIFKKFALRGKTTTDSYVEEKIEYFLSDDRLILMTDWVESLEDNDSIFNYIYDQAVAASTTWHERDKYSSGKYDPASKDNIVHGPQWIDDKGNIIPQYQGWTIQIVMSENDLEVEGEKMSHCVGSYYHQVKNEQSIIYSLRDPSNGPHITMETDGSGVEAYQIFGKSNSEPKQEYKTMIANWVELGNNSPQTFNEEDEPLYDIKYSTWQRGFDEMLATIVDEKVSGKNEYGFKSEPVSIDEIEHVFEQSCIAVGAYNDRGDYYGDRGISDSLVALALSGGVDTLEYLFELIQKKEEEVWVNFADMDIGIPYPQEEDFEDLKDYEKAEADYQAQEQDIINNSFPMGWFAEIYKETRRQLDTIYHTTLEKFLAEKVAKAKNWYKKAIRHI